MNSRPDFSGWSVLDLAVRIERYYDFESTRGPLRNCIEWRELTKRLLELNRITPKPSDVVSQKID